ncbi:hypothetical protein ACIBI0_09760 [Microbispora rosea]|uniref:hypothetical protein n=1 Tax=Microbispora rosea TaxID=58117 RepID=UPI00343496D7
MLPAAPPVSLRLAGAGTALAAETREYRVDEGRTLVPPRAALTITLPGSVNLGSGARGGTISASMGTVTVVDSRGGLPPWTATVSATNFTTGSGTPAQTITTANVAYWSGPVTTSSGPGTRNPGQATAASPASHDTSAAHSRRWRWPWRRPRLCSPACSPAPPPGRVSVRNRRRHGCGSARS